MKMKKNIAVLMGGRSLEREISIKSGQRVSNALRNLGYDVTKLDIDQSIIDNLSSGRFDLAYIALHGKDGEDGTIQEILEVLEIPYTGPGVYPNALSFNKIISKQIFNSLEIPVPDFYFLNASSFRELGASKLLPYIVKKLGLPLVVKPSAQGSALGIKLVEKKEDLSNAIISALGYNKKVILEKYIEGIELAVSIIGKEKPEVLPVVEIVPENNFFDFESRSKVGKTEYFIPARIQDDEMKKVMSTALSVHKALKCTNLSRVDIIMDKKDRIPYVLELNTSPGMTDISLLPMAAKEAGMSFEELVDKIVKMSIR
ncbi:MAG TPA: D-alanine--D-alanine ligase [Actinobacteria bacterium]|nr:D-alanine--D-alanine ligase [Actinomycetota bacterium]